jgi:two-component system alkaline phosphatase synthesis response regulator PhoP
MSNEKYKILLVDDEPDVLEFLGYNLRKEGYQVHACLDGEEAVKKAEEMQPHLIILDVMMPGMDGIETCAEIRKLGKLQDSIVIFLTARGEDYSQIAGFEAGADDYLTKPIKPKILLSRVKALLRRYKESTPRSTDNGSVKFKDFTIDKERYVVMKDKREIIFPKKEFELLLLLTSRPNKVFSREEIFAKVWGSDVIVGDRTIDVHIRKIREKLSLKNIRTVKGVGYKFES